MEFDFDEIIPRKGTDCVKYDGPDVGDRLPLWDRVFQDDLW